MKSMKRQTKKLFAILLLIVLFSSICGIAKVLISNQRTGIIATSTSPYVVSTEIHRLQQDEQASNTITFSESPVGTYITDQYSNRGIIFGGDSPFITTDGTNPTSPVLSGTPLFQGAIEGRFVNPYDGISPITVSSFSLDAGVFDVVGSTRIEWFDLHGNKLGEQMNSTLGIEHFVIEGHGIGRWRIAIISSEPAGFAIDNLNIGDINDSCYILEFSKVDDVNDGDCVGPGGKINYRIDYNYPAGPNCPDINDVLIIDYLPVEVNYVSSDPCGSYDSNSNTVTWDINALEPNESGFVTLTVLVNEDAEPNSTITNYCEIKADFVLSYATAVTNVCCFGSDIIYVKADANGCNNGKSWQNAYTEIQSALNRARFCGANEIWVAAGTYKGTFQIVDGVALYGGFAGTETSRSQRNWLANETTLTGDINGDGNGDIVYVVTASDVNETTIIDGFKITKGTSAGIYCYNTTSPTIQNNKITRNHYGIYCRGIYSERSNPKITNCVVEDNSDIGIYCSDYASPTISNCIITGNRSGSAGGGMYTEYSYSSGPIVTNCIFAANTASTSGGGIYNNSSSPIVVNCIFAANTATYYGGGIYGWNLRVINCTFTKNRAGMDGGGICKTGNSSVSNCIFWGNYAGRNGNQIYPDNDPNFSYCDIQGGSTGTGNINADPCFVDPNGPDGITGTEDDNLRLLGNSPCIDAGNNAAVPAGVTTDLDGRERFADGDCNTTVIVDMGAYEFTYAYFGDFDSDCGVDFKDFAILAASWLQNNPLTDIAPTPAGDGIVDASDLAILCDNWLAGK